MTWATRLVTLLAICSITSSALAQTPHQHPRPGRGEHRAERHDGHGARDQADLEERIPAFCAEPTIASVKPGAWSDVATWGGRAPEPGAAVHVAHDVVYDVSSPAALACVRVTGALRFRDDVDTRLVVGTMVVAGLLQVGSHTAPIPRHVTAELVIGDQPLDTVFDPNQFGTGLLVLDGVWTMHGAPVDRTFVRLSEEPLAGTTRLVTEHATQWRPGDEVIIPDTRQLRRAERGTDHTERRRIVSVQGTTLTLDRPLASDHRGARNPDGVLERLPHVANVARNVVVRSANPEGTRGHLLAHHRAQVDVRYVAFRDLGRTTIEPLDNTTYDGEGRVLKIGANQIGRYAIHLHHLWGPARTRSGEPQSQLIGNAVVDSAKWGIALHGTHFGLVKDNVVAFADGAGIALEDGNEFGNRIEGNFVVSVRGDGRGPAGSRIKANDVGHEGAGIWARGPFSHFDGNVIAATRHSGVAIISQHHPTRDIPESPGADMENASQTERGDFTRHGQVVENTEIYSTRLGFDIWFLLHGGFEARGTHIWHAWESGVFFTYTTSHRWRDLWVRGDPDVMRSSDRHEHATGMNWVTSTYVREGIVERADIQGYRLGFTVPAHHLAVSESLFRNWVNMDHPYWADRIQSRIFERSRFEPVPGGPADHVIVRPAARQGRPPHWQQLMRTMTRNVYLFRDVTVSGHPYDGTWRLYNEHQAPDHQLGDPLHRTNAEAWRDLGLAVGDAVAVCTTKRPGLSAFFCPVSGQDAEVNRTVVQSFHGWTASASPATLTYFEYDCRGDSLFHDCSASQARRREKVTVQPGDNWITREILGRRWSGFVRWSEERAPRTDRPTALSAPDEPASGPSRPGRPARR